MHFDYIDRKDFQRTNIISRKYNTVWKQFAGRNVIGDCSNLFQRLKPLSYYDFYVKYTKDGEETISARPTFRYYGRTEKEIEEIAIQYRNACNDFTFSLEDYIKNIYMHVIIETFDGQIKEQEVGQILSNLGYTYTKPIGDEDSKLGIDFKVFKDNILTFVIQVKPISFFTGIHNQSLIEDRLNAFTKVRNVLKLYNVPTYFMIYRINTEGNVEWLIENSKLCFTLERLINKTNGHPNNIEPNFKKS